MIPVYRNDLRLKADSRKVLLRFLDFGNPSRFEPVIRYVVSLHEEEVDLQLRDICKEFEHRHFDLETVFLDNFQRISAYMPHPVSRPRQLLLGAYFTHEYSIQSAALFNPSIVPHPDQSGLYPGELRFILSLRATGEGHISSIAFMSGVLGADLDIRLDNVSLKISSGKRFVQKQFQKSSFRSFPPGMDVQLFDQLSAYFTPEEVLKALEMQPTRKGEQVTALKASLSDFMDAHYSLEFEKDVPLESRILFPSSRSESNGMEDARFVRFGDEEGTRYLGTYTAYNGRSICPHLIETTDFQRFNICPLGGKAVSDKGMALFPEKVNGQYVMVGRQGGRSLSIMFSGDLYHWDTYTPLQHPGRNWEMLQMGNCGSPLKTPQGWLLLTHAVGPMRKYVLSLTLLDLNHPERVIASLEQPLLSPTEEEREGYVPNVLYTCGMLEHNGHLIIPYAMSDSAIGFARVETSAVLHALLQ